MKKRFSRISRIAVTLFCLAFLAVPAFSASAAENMPGLPSKYVSQMTQSNKYGDTIGYSIKVFAPSEVQAPLHTDTSSPDNTLYAWRNDPDYNWKFNRWYTYYVGPTGLVTFENDRATLGGYAFSDGYDIFTAYDPTDTYIGVSDVRLMPGGTYYLYAVYDPKLTVDVRHDLPIRVTEDGSEKTSGTKHLETYIGYGNMATVRVNVGDLDVTSVSVNGTPTTRYSINDGSLTVSVIMDKPRTISVNTRGKPYTVEYHSNDGEDDVRTQILYRNTEGELLANTFSKENFVFGGWNTSPDGTGTSYADQSKVTLSPSGNTLKLYAKWIHTAHEGGTATCTDKPVCTVCCESYGEIDPDNHTGQCEWTVMSETQHERRYSCCGVPTVGLSIHEWVDGACFICRYGAEDDTDNNTGSGDVTTPGDGTDTGNPGGDGGTGGSIPSDPNVPADPNGPGAPDSDGPDGSGDNGSGNTPAEPNSGEGDAAPQPGTPPTGDTPVDWSSLFAALLSLLALTGAAAFLKRRLSKEQ